MHLTSLSEFAMLICVNLNLSRLENTTVKLETFTQEKHSAYLHEQNYY
jgi:predicted transcriptional regulator YheO